MEFSPGRRTAGVNVNVAAMGDAAARLILTAIQGAGDPLEQVEIEAWVEPRDSFGPARRQAVAWPAFAPRPRPAAVPEAQLIGSPH